MIHNIKKYINGAGHCACGAIHTDRIYQYGKDLYHVPEGASKTVERIRKHLVSESARVTVSHYASLLVAGTLKSLSGVKTRSINDRIRVNRCIAALADCIPESDIWKMKASINHAAEQLK